MSFETTANADEQKSQWWRSKYITVPLRIGLSVALLVVVIVSMDDIDWDELPDWNSETAIWSIGAFVFTITGFILGAVRWQRVLIALGVRQPLGRLFSHYMSGQFVSNFLPTTVGGDVV